MMVFKICLLLSLIIFNFISAVKECFFEDEIRCILIKKTKNGKKAKYYSRSCSNSAAGIYIKYIVKVCNSILQCWFYVINIRIWGANSQNIIVDLVQIVLQVFI